jgi:hypothetical protein
MVFIARPRGSRHGEYQLGKFRNPKEAAQAYDYMVVQHNGARVHLNFPQDQHHAHLLAPEGIRFATREENSCMNFLVY